MESVGAAKSPTQPALWQSKSAYGGPLITSKDRQNEYYLGYKNIWSQTITERRKTHFTLICLSCEVLKQLLLNFCYVAAREMKICHYWPWCIMHKYIWNYVGWHRRILLDLGKLKNSKKNGGEILFLIPLIPEYIVYYVIVS